MPPRSSGLRLLAWIPASENGLGPKVETLLRDCRVAPFLAARVPGPICHDAFPEALRFKGSQPLGFSSGFVFSHSGTTRQLMELHGHAEPGASVTQQRQDSLVGFPQVLAGGELAIVVMPAPSKARTVAFRAGSVPGGLLLSLLPIGQSRGVDANKSASAIKHGRSP
jgi:hypothetical protein